MHHLFRLCVPLVLVFTKSVEAANFQKDSRKIWAVLVAGSDGWWNYRHQADVCHAYQLLRKRGIPEENIITFMVDDIASNEENPFKGKIFNDYKHNDVYEGVVIDYRGDDVTVDNFKRVLTGDPKLQTIGKKVLQSGPDDNVFIYFTDHGSLYSVGFPDTDLTARELNETINYMHEHKRYKHMVLYIEACESGSMFKNILSNHISVYATTAAMKYESSYATFCDDSEILPCLADEYSYNWISDSESHVPSEWTLYEQYERVANMTKQSRPQQYGDMNMKNLTIDQFQSRYLKVGKEDAWETYMLTADSVPSYNARTHMLKRRLMSAVNQEEKKFYKGILNRALQLASIAEYTVNEIDSHVRKSKVMKHVSTGLYHMECAEIAYGKFQKKCFSIRQVPEVALHIGKLNKLCEQGYNMETIVHSMAIICG